MSQTIYALVKAFMEVANDMHGEYVEAWLKGDVKDYDFDMVLIDEKHNRESRYKKFNKLFNDMSVREKK